MKPTDQDLEVLRAISVSGAVTAGELAKEFPHFKDLKAHMEKLWSFKFLDCDRVPNKPIIYQLSAKGARHVRKEAMPEYVGEVVKARQVQVMRAPTYTGERPRALRPGAEDFLAIKSRGM